jgi:5'-3' exonuclease
VGPKTAQTLLSKHQNLEGVYAHLDENKGKLLENLTADKESAFLSRDLGTIRRDVDIDLNLTAAKLDDYDSAQAEAFLKHYEFFSLLKRLPKNGNAPTEESVAAKPKKKQKVQLLVDAASAKAFFCKSDLGCSGGTRAPGRESVWRWPGSSKFM